MVDTQIAARGIVDERVLAAMRAVPRETFVPDDLAEFAYDDTPLPIGEGQTISQPYIVALMAELAELGPGDRVLDVGTGSGYGAAVASRIAREVHTIERHRQLAAAARKRFAALNCDNIHVHHGDGSVGCPEHAPFDAILVAAGGPEVPEALRRQLAIGGRLVIPVGAASRRQTLLRIVRNGEDDYDTTDFGAVAFVPLVGAGGWQEGGDPKPAVLTDRPGPARFIREACEALPPPTEDAFGALFDRVGSARVVLLGEATHGTSEFYLARARITERLIREHGFTIVAVEADWPDAAQIDRYVRHREAPPPDQRAFARFPTWMWRNVEMRDFVLWLRAHNRSLPARRQAAFYGLDLYSLHESIAAVLDYLDRADPVAARVARERYGCLTPWQHDPATYGRAALNRGYDICAAEVIATLDDLLARRLDYLRHDGEAFLDAERNARLIAAAERYYRVMYYGSSESWNLRDRHMFETLEAVLAARGPDAKAVVWAHNSHVGDARSTEMGVVRDQLNIGQLCREKFGDNAVLIGFGTDRGTVAAASEWGGAMEVKTITPAHDDSYERLFRDAGRRRCLIDLRSDRNRALHDMLLHPRLERAIGVVYRPETELASHYFEASLPRQFDSYVWFEETSAVTPLPAAQVPGADTFPFGL